MPVITITDVAVRAALLDVINNNNFSKLTAINATFTKGAVVAFVGVSVAEWDVYPSADKLLCIRRYLAHRNDERNDLTDIVSNIKAIIAD